MSHCLNGSKRLSNFELLDKNLGKVYLVSPSLDVPMIPRFVKYARDPLYKNSSFIMLSSITNAGFGFFFWMFAAKLYFVDNIIKGLSNIG